MKKNKINNDVSQAENLQNEQQKNYEELQKNHEELKKDHEELQAKIKAYTEKIIEAQLILKEMEKKIEIKDSQIEDLERKIYAVELDAKNKADNYKKEDLKRIYEIMNLIKIIKGKSSNKETIDCMNLFQTSMMKKLTSLNVQMKEFFIGDNFYELSEEDQNLCNVITIEDPSLPNGYIKDIISNAFINGDQISHAQIFIVKK